MTAPSNFQMVPTPVSAEVIRLLTQEAAQAIQQALTELARSRDDAAARGERHAHVRGYCAQFRLLSSPSGPVIQVCYLSPACLDEHGAPELVPAL